MSPKKLAFLLLTVSTALISTSMRAQQSGGSADSATIVLTSNNLKRRTLTLDGLFYETANGRISLPASLTRGVKTISGARWSADTRMPDGRLIRLTVTPQSGTFTIAMTATPREGVTRWGVEIG